MAIYIFIYELLTRGRVAATGYSPLICLFVISEPTHLDAIALYSIDMASTQQGISRHIYSCAPGISLIGADFDAKASLSNKSEQKLRSLNLHS